MRAMPRRGRRQVHPVDPSLGPLVIIGGRFEDDNDRLFDALQRLSGGNVLVFATASQAPQEVGGGLVRDLQQRGAQAELIDLTLENSKTTAFDPDLAAKITSSGGAYFTGGDQQRIVASLIQEGSETPLLRALRALHAGGGMIAGSSAGAAMQCDPMILGGASLEALTIGKVEDPDQPGIALGRGLGFFPYGMIDQHFIERGRMGRLAAGLLASGQRFGFGVDENTGMILENGMLRIVGETGVVVMDMQFAEHDKIESAVSNIRVSFLDDGDGFDLETGKALPATDKKYYRPRPGKAIRSRAGMPRDVFGSYALHELWLRLAQGDPQVYAFEEATATDLHTKAKVTLSLRRQPRVSRVLKDHRDRCSMINFLLGIRVEEPARIAAPLSWVAGAEAPALPERDEPDFRRGHIVLGGSKSLQAPIEQQLRVPGQRRPAIGDNSALFESCTVNFGGTAEQNDGEVIARLERAPYITLATPDRGSMLHKITLLGESAPIRGALFAALDAGATLNARGDAAPALGYEVIAHGDARAAIRWGVSSDAGAEGLIIERGLGLVPGIVETDIDGEGGLGRLIVACAERQLLGWAIPSEAGFEFDAAAGRASAFGGATAFMVTVEPHKVVSTTERLDVRDACITPVPPGSSEWFDGTGPEEDAASLAAIEGLIDGFARQIGAQREGCNGPSWSGDELLMRLHKRRGGVAALDISCHRSRMAADIR